MAEKAPRVIKYGNDFFRKITSANTQKNFNATYWDLWIAMILVNQFDNNIDKLIDGLRLKAKNTSLLRYKFEGLLNHIRLLQQTLSENGLCFADILGEIDDDFIRSKKNKVKVKILEMGYQSHEESKWMINTPRKIRGDQAMRGHWPLFPVNPEKYADLLENLYKTSGMYTRSQSFTLQNKLKSFLDKYTSKLEEAELFSLYRAFLTVVLEKIEMVDDSHGVVGDLYGDVFSEYYLLDRSKLDMGSADFLLDIIELIIWEDYGLTDSHQAGFFKKLTDSEIALVTDILLKEKEELDNLELTHQARNAQKFLDKFIKK
jgi:hypothetical protein